MEQTNNTPFAADDGDRASHHQEPSFRLDESADDRAAVASGVEKTTRADIEGSNRLAMVDVETIESRTLRPPSESESSIAPSPDPTMPGRDMKHVLFRDAFAIIFVANPKSKVAIVAWGVLLVQWGFMITLVLNVIDTTNTTNGTKNMFHVPAGVSPLTFVAKILGFLLTVMVIARGDSMRAVTLMQEGCPKEISEKYFYSSSVIRWKLICWVQFLTGLIFILLSSIFLISSHTPLDVFMDLTGLHFLQEIDNIGFEIASMGYFGAYGERLCNMIAALKIPTNRAAEGRGREWKVCLWVVLSIAWLKPWLFATAHQLNGVYLCHNINVQFGDGLVPHMGYYSGIFTFKQQPFARAIYKHKSGELQLGWCNEEKAWTFYNSTNNTDSCKAVIFKTARTETFDAMEVAEMQWYYSVPGGVHDIAVDFLGMSCQDCVDKERCANGEYCQSYEKENICSDISIDEENSAGMHDDAAQQSCRRFGFGRSAVSGLQSNQVASVGATATSSEFKVLDSVTTVHERLVYTSIGLAPEYVANVSGQDYPIRTILLFSGRRWVILSLREGLKPRLTDSDLSIFLQQAQNETSSAAHLLQRLRNGNLTKHFEPRFFSSPVDYGTTLHSIHPTGISWFPAKRRRHDPILGYVADEAQPLSESLACMECQWHDDCQNGGVCIPTTDALYLDNYSKCECPPFYVGSHCQYSKGCEQFGNRCFNGGSCNPASKSCDCPFGYSGNLCQFTDKEISVEIEVDASNNYMYDPSQDRMPWDCRTILVYNETLACECDGDIFQDEICLNTTIVETEAADAP